MKLESGELVEFDYGMYQTEDENISNGLQKVIVKDPTIGITYLNKVNKSVEMILHPKPRAVRGARTTSNVKAI